MHEAVKQTFKIQLIVLSLRVLSVLLFVLSYETLNWIHLNVKAYCPTA